MFDFRLSQVIFLLSAFLLLMSNSASAQDLTTTTTTYTSTTTTTASSLPTDHPISKRKGGSHVCNTTDAEKTIVDPVTKELYTVYCPQSSGATTQWDAKENKPGCCKDNKCSLIVDVNTCPGGTHDAVVQGYKACLHKVGNDGVYIAVDTMLAGIVIGILAGNRLFEAFW